MKRVGYLFLFVMIAVSVWGKTYTVEAIPNVQLTDRTQFVSNPDGIVSPEAARDMNRVIAMVRDSTTAEIAVVLVQSIGDSDILQFSTELFQKWGIGKRDKDNGLLILYVGDQRKINFEVGYGMEGVLPDAICKRIQTQVMVPYFKEGKIDAGMVKGVVATAEVIMNPEYAQELRSAQKEGTTSKNPFGFILVFYAIVAVLITLYVVVSLIQISKSPEYGNNYERYKALNHLHKMVVFSMVLIPLPMLLIGAYYLIHRKGLRTAKMPCARCGVKMRRLNEQEDNEYLNSSENTEEELGSVDYDVWLCPSCQHKEVFRYDAAFSRYGVCPFCKARTYSLESSNTLRYATQFSEGVREDRYVCLHCHNSKVQRISIPRLPVVIVSGGGGRGGGFGGGGGGFGGGRSGGGGASSGW